MRLFAYYVVHTVFNSIKKLFKTWLAFFFIVILFGMLVGFISGTVASSLDKQNKENEVSEETVEDNPEADYEEVIKLSFKERIGWNTETTVEIVISGLFLLMVVLSIINSKGMAEIFHPADVAILFSSPMKPQNVLLFRLGTSLGTQLVVSLVMVFQIPNFIYSLHFSVPAAISFIFAWALLCIMITLFQVLFYMLASYNDFLKSNLKLFLWGAVGLVAVGYGYCLIRNDRNVFLAIEKMFSGAKTYWIPFWGWLRGFCMSMVQGSYLMAALFAGLMIAGIVLLIVVISKLKVDYYEDALISAEKKAAKIEQAKSSNNGMSIRNKARSEKIERDGFDKGFGANVFFYKTMYNRRRLGVFKGITKTMLIYLAATVFVIVMTKVTKVGHPFLMVCGIMTAICFFRTMGNPLKEDVSKEFFAMIPASARAKLFWSVLGGLTNTALDLIVPYILAVVYLKVDPLEAILWFIFILTIDLYGTIIGNFIYISVAVALPDTIQKMVQIMFIYFGAMPALVFLIIGIVFNRIVWFMPFGILTNLGVSFLFFMVSPHFIENGRK